MQGRFDLIIGSDALYERNDGGALAAFIERHAPASCEVWGVDPNRGNRPAFTRALAALGFGASETPLEGPGPRGRLLRFSRAVQASGKPASSD